MKHYILDHCFVSNHEDFARIVSSERDDKNEVGEILAAIQFWWEEHVDENSDPELDAVIEVLCDYFDFWEEDKDEHSTRINFILEDQKEWYAETYDMDGEVYEYIDLYITREHHCGPGRTEKLFEKWLTESGVKEAIEKCPARR